MKRVLITADYDQESRIRIYNAACSVAEDYEIVPFIKAGGLPCLFPAVPFAKEHIEAFVDMSDLVVLTGGHDINPLRYSEEVLYDNVRRYAHRDEMEYLLLETAIKQHKPVFGICRGAQLINVFFGGTLYQNITKQTETTVLHRQQIADAHMPVHRIDIEEDSFLFRALQQQHIFVNSFHNQAVKDLGNGLRVVAKSTDGIVEAIEHTSYPVYAVQWHPEMMYETDEMAKKLIDWVVNH